MKSLSKIVVILALVVFSFCLISCPSPDNEVPAGNTPAGTSGSGTLTGNGTSTGTDTPSGTSQSQTPTTYSITVTNGTANLTTATAGETVTITANSASSGQAFNGWTTTTNGITFANASSTTTTFTMPASNVSITATYAQIYSISVTNCTANPTSATAGTTITVTANQAPSDLVYSPGNWTVTPSTEYTESGGSITFTMPESNVTVSLSFVAPSYSINVTGGNANPTSAPAGTTVTLTSRYAPVSGNYVNWSWTPTNLFFTNPYGYQTTFVMPAQDVDVSAECVVGECYEITVNVENIGGDVVSNPTIAPVGNSVILQSKPDINAGYHTEWSFSTSVNYSTLVDNKIQFTMPENNVRVNIYYVKD